MLQSNTNLHESADVGLWRWITCCLVITMQLGLGSVWCGWLSQQHGTRCASVSCRRLQEQYSLGAQLFCHQELLLPGHTVQLKLVLSLQLHGIPAPVQLLQELQLSLTAHTPEGGPVTQVRLELQVPQIVCCCKLKRQGLGSHLLLYKGWVHLPITATG